MSEHTKTPWLIVPGKAFIYALDENGVNRFQASIDGAHCPESELIANARHIVNCVNNHERLVEALSNALACMESDLEQIEGEWGMCRSLETLEREGELTEEILEARAILAALEAEKGGEF